MSTPTIAALSSGHSRRQLGRTLKQYTSPQSRRRACMLCERMQTFLVQAKLWIKSGQELTLRGCWSPNSQHSRIPKRLFFSGRSSPNSVQRLPNRSCALNMPKSTGPVGGMARVTAENILSVLDGKWCAHSGYYGKPNHDNAINPEVLGLGLAPQTR